MSDFRKEWLTLDELAGIARVPAFFYPHVTYDPALQPQYRIRRQTTNDSTLIFLMEMIERALLPLINCETYYLPMRLPEEGFVPQYTVGRIKLATVFGMVDLPCGRYSGQRQRLVIHVSVRYVPKESAKLPDYALIREYQEAMRQAVLSRSSSASRFRIYKDGETQEATAIGGWLSSKSSPPMSQPWSME
jgi:hypothetical protein